MNIFATSVSPRICAQNLDDRRLIKMILESAQLLSTAIYINSNNYYDDLYKPTHIKHPCTIWASLNLSNWNWLYNHLKYLCEEYNYRFSKSHKTAALIISLQKYLEYLPKGEITTFPNCARSKILGIDYTNIKDIHLAYQEFLIAKWNNDKLPARWTRRNPPSWKPSILHKV